MTNNKKCKSFILFEFGYSIILGYWNLVIDYSDNKHLDNKPIVIAG